MLRVLVPHWVCGVVVSRSLRMGEARGSIPRTSNFFPSTFFLFIPFYHISHFINQKIYLSNLVYSFLWGFGVLGFWGFVG